MIDYYGITGKHNFPRWEEALQEHDIYKRMVMLEQGMKEDVEEDDKVVYGNYLAESIGLSKIRERCPRFNLWIESLAGVRDM